jgi:trehalose 6-phosphate synthase
VLAQFWHIPWPGREVVQVCPWHEELIDGLLGNDLLGFHVQEHCNNFLETADRSVECRVDPGRFSVTRGGHTTLVRPYPISVDPDLADEALPADWPRLAEGLRERLGVGDRKLLVGVDRLDYIKGIPERIRAVDRLLTREPRWRGRFCLVQIGAPSRTHLVSYRDLRDEVRAQAAAVNARHGTDGWRPVVFWEEHVGQEEITLLYRLAAACVVTSLHDGMNLVAKEFVAARADRRGALVLSPFAGAARELTGALVANPYDTDALAGALRAALAMPPEEQRRRMAAMRAQVCEHNIFRWAGRLLSEAGRLLEGRPRPPAGHGQRPPAWARPFAEKAV